MIMMMMNQHPVLSKKFYHWTYIETLASSDQYFDKLYSTVSVFYLFNIFNWHNSISTFRYWSCEKKKKIIQQQIKISNSKSMRWHRYSLFYFSHGPSNYKTTFPFVLFVVYIKIMQSTRAYRLLLLLDDSQTAEKEQKGQGPYLLLSTSNQAKNESSS